MAKLCPIAAVWAAVGRKVLAKGHTKGRTRAEQSPWEVSVKGTGWQRADDSHSCGYHSQWCCATVCHNQPQHLADIKLQQMPSEFPDFVWEAIKAEQLWTGGEPCVLSAVLEELYTKYDRTV